MRKGFLKLLKHLLHTKIDTFDVFLLTSGGMQASWGEE